MKVKEIIVLPIDLDFNLPSKTLAINSKFDGKEYVDTITYSEDGIHQYNVNNCINFVEYQMLQKSTKIDDITNEIHKGFIQTIGNILDSIPEIEKLTNKPVTFWKNKAGIVIYNDNVVVAANIPLVDFLSSNFPFINSLSDEAIGNIKEVYICWDKAVVLTSKTDNSAIVFEMP